MNDLAVFLFGFVVGLVSWPLVKRAAFVLWGLRMKYRYRHLKKWTGEITWVPEELSADDVARIIRDNATSDPKRGNHATRR